MKRIWSLITVVVMAIFILPITAYATEEVTPIVCGDYEYTLNENNEATITAYNGTATELVIPEKLDGYTVVEIGDKAFYNNGIFEKITIPDSIVRIGMQAFEQCENLKEVKLSYNLVELGYNAFGYCDLLQSIEIPKSLKNIDSNVFTFCHSLKTVSFEDGTTEIIANLFCLCSGLEEITIPSTVTQIGEFAFAHTNLKKINIPDNVEKIGVAAFSGCDSLIEVSLPSNITQIDTLTFNGCISLTTIEIPNSVSEIGYGAFEGSGLRQITLSNNILGVGECAFLECENLSNVQLGSGITVLDNEVFKGCTSLEEINIGCGIRVINDDVFAECTNLTKVTIPQTTSSIHMYAFDDPTQLTVYGVPGSYAQTWANTNGATFVEFEKHATSVSISPTKVSLNKGEWINLPTVSVIPVDCTDKVVWTTDDWLVASVSDELYGNGPGTTTITATVGELSASCEVTVISLGTDIVFSYQNVDAEFLGAYIYDSNGNYIEKISNNNKYDKTVTLEGISQGTYTVEIYGEDFVSRKYTIVVGDTVVNQEVELHKAGDITGDNTINARDKKMLYNHIAGTAILEDYDFAVGDVTGDGTLNARDKKIIYNHIAGTSSLWN